jgi:hypothetical protein
MPAPKPKTDEKPQFERFIEAATRTEADTTDAALAATIRKIATPAAKRGMPRRTSK